MYAHNEERERNRVDISKYEVRRATCAMNEKLKKKSIDSESTDTTACCSFAYVSWIAHTSCYWFLVLTGRVEVTDIHFQAGYLCMKKKSYRCIIVH